MFFGRFRWSIPEDFLQYSHYIRVVRALDKTSSPGFPYLRNCMTNAQFFGCREDEFDNEKLSYVWQLVQDRLQERDADPIRVFIKQEPHKKKKLDSKTYRLISSVSVVDQIIDHMLFDEFNGYLVDNNFDLPTKGGWTPMKGGYRLIPKANWVAVDKSKWDWTVKLWLFEMELDFRVRTCKNLTDQWLDLAKWRYTKLFKDPEFITSNGICFKQRKPGVMKSGCVNTLPTNSIMQIILHIRVCRMLGIPVSNIFSLGDDTLQEMIEMLKPYLSLLAEFCLVKHYKFDHEFAGFRYADTIEPLYKGKHAFQLLHLDEKWLDEVSHSYTLLYHRSQDRDFIRSVFDSLGADMASLQKCDAIWEGVE